MHREMKQDLDASLPESITLDETKKKSILEEAHKKIVAKQSLRKPFIKPLIATVAVVVLTGIIAFPYVQQELRQQASQEVKIANAIQRVTIQGVNYANLIRAIYVDNTNELIYTDGKGIFSYSLDSNTTETVVAPKDESEILGVSVAANEDWIVWDNLGESTYVLNRGNGELKEIDDPSGFLQIADNRLIYMAFSEHDKTRGYDQINLLTFEKSRLHKSTGEGSNSYPGIHYEKVVISERMSKKAGGGVSFTIYNLEKNSQIGVYTLPFESAENVTITDDKMYVSLFDKDLSSKTLGYIDLNDGQFHEVEVPEFNAYAVYENYLALSIRSKDSDTVKLFEIKDGKVEPLPYLNHIQERLVKPRFTKEGMLIVNGEGADHSMYVIDVEMLD